MRLSRKQRMEVQSGNIGGMLDVLHAMVSKLEIGRDFKYKSTMKVLGWRKRAWTKSQWDPSG